MSKKTTSKPKKTWMQRNIAFRLLIWQWRFALVALAAGVAATGIVQTLAPAAPPQATVLFASRGLPVGTMVTEDDLTEVSIAQRYASGLVTDRSEVVGRVTITGVAAGAPIWDSGLSSSDLGGVAPPGLVVVPLRLDAVTTSVLIPGDSVDLVAITSDGPTVVARGALVLPARLETAAAASGLFSAGSANTPVTLVAVNPGEAPQVASGAHLNQITAILIP